MKCILYVGPVSTEVLDAVLRVNHDDSRGVRLCCSEGQVGPDAYTGLTWATFKRHLEEARRRHAACSAKTERDHAGREVPPGWLEDNNSKTWQRIRQESSFFDATHVHAFDLHQAALECVHRGEWAIGPGEDDSLEITWPIDPMLQWNGWVAAPFGPRICGLNNANMIDMVAIKHAREKFPRALLRCHACDYLQRRTLSAIKRLVDGINVAPQLGVVQSTCYLSIAAKRGLDVEDWRQACHEDAKQLTRWGLVHGQWYGVGHYHFDQIAWREEFRDVVVEHLANFIKELDDA